MANAATVNIQANSRLGVPPAIWYTEPHQCTGTSLSENALVLTILK
jgi:hypothetical protein